METPGYTLAPRREVCAQAERMTFDYAMLITVDSRAQTIQNWYHFSGHPDTWTDDFKRHLAWRMASATADSLQDEVKNKGRMFKVEQPVIAFRPLPDETALFWIVRTRSEGKKRITFVCEFSMQEIGVGVRWWRVLDAEIPYWGCRFLLGPLSFRLGVDL